MHKFGLNKRQRLCSHTAIDLLFSPDKKQKGVNGHIMAYPWRAVWLREENENLKDNFNKILISIPKKRVRHAVDRVKMRRRCREAYRLNQWLLPRESNADIAFIYVGQGLSDFIHTQKSVVKILNTIAEKISKEVNNEE